MSSGGQAEMSLVKNHDSTALEPAAAADEQRGCGCPLGNVEHAALQKLDSIVVMGFVSGKKSRDSGIPHVTNPFRLTQKEKQL